MDRVLRTALTIAIIYMVIGGLWIYISDTALKGMVEDLASMRLLQTWKGWGYVFVTSLLIFWMSWTALSRQRSLIDQLERLAYLNPLTGLPSRSATNSMVDKAIQRAARNKTGVAVVQFDLDNFSTINDSFGHEVGDELLCTLAERLVECLGRDSSLAHLGADDFIMVFEGVRTQVDLEQWVDQVREELARPFPVEGVSEVFVSASMGVSFYPADADSATQLLRFADAALARAKRYAPGTIETFSQELVESARRRLQIDARLRGALENEELCLHFQPVFHSGKELSITGLEALLRWQPPGEEPVSPSEFIPIAEQSGLILEIGAWVIDQACAQISMWEKSGMAYVPLSVNLSVRQFMAPGLVEQITGAMDRHQIPRSSLTLEITESLLMEQEDIGREVLNALRAEGLNIALDDFGTGYSSLSYLRELPIDTLKIDRSFVGNLERGKSDHDLVAAMISLADIFGLHIVAEGVETKAQQEILEGLGCHDFQGFLFSKPLPAEEVSLLLQDNGN